MAGQAAPLKDQLFTPEKVGALAQRIELVHPAFLRDEFVSSVLERFPELELKGRISWMAECLEGYLPRDFRHAVGILLQSLPAPADPTLTDGDFGDFVYAPYSEYVARGGCSAADLEFSLAALRETTTRFSAEFAIRPFLDAFPGKVLATLLTWTDDEHYHVRRLCSEGTRPRLPWAKNLTLPYDAGIPILDRLFADPTRYVIRSVANHVNDISKKDPDLALDSSRGGATLGGNGLARWNTSSVTRRGRSSGSVTPPR